VYSLSWRLLLAVLVAFGNLQFSQIRGRQPYSIVRNILYVIRAGDAANAILSAVGYNLRLLAWLRMILRVVLLALVRTLAIQPAVKSAF
jgi:hypothetical protein